MNKTYKRKYKNKRRLTRTKTKKNKIKYTKNNLLGENNQNNIGKKSWDPNIISPVFFGYKF